MLIPCLPINYKAPIVLLQIPQLLTHFCLLLLQSRCLNVLVAAVRPAHSVPRFYPVAAVRPGILTLVSFPRLFSYDRGRYALIGHFQIM